MSRVGTDTFAVFHVNPVLAETAERTCIAYSF